MKLAGRGRKEGGFCTLCLAWRVLACCGRGEDPASAAGHGLRVGFEAVARGVGPREGRLDILYILRRALAEPLCAIAPSGSLDPSRGR